LHRVVTDNTITYQDDKTNNAWTVGYYLGSAQMRIEKAWDTLVKSPELTSRAMAAGVSTIVDSWELDARSTLFEWQMTHNSLIRLFKILHPASVLMEHSVICTPAGPISA
jgi:hypothetical protein